MARILLIEDMSGVRRAVRAVLTNAGHDVVEATDGEEGLDRMNSAEFDLVITDILMPKTDGTEVIMEMDRMARRPPVVAMSGGGSQVPADMALLVSRTRADATLVKPFENKDLLATVDRLLAARAA
jgi:CheY-like chemotaxis protein